MGKMKKFGSLLLCIALLFTMMPTTAFAAIDADKTATFSEGSILRGSDGETYQFSKAEQGYVSIHYFNTATGKMDVFSGQYDSGEPKRTYIVQQGGTSYRGYCVEHGVHVDGSKKLKASDSSELVYAGLSMREVQNLQLALFYGCQSGDTIEDLYKNGFKESRYYGKNGSNYNWQDWYIATQCLVWEIQQGNRSESMQRQANDLGVGANHYFSIVSGRPAADIYNWMVAAIKAHFKFPAAVNSADYAAPKTINLGEEGKTEYTYSFKDTTSMGTGYVVGTGQGKNFKKDNNVTITYNESTKKYDLTFTGEPTDKVYTVKHAADGKTPKNNLLFWHWESNNSHVQTITTGAADPVVRYITFKTTEAPEVTPPDEPEEPGNPLPEPEYVPSFEIPISKVDANSGWDGDVSTGMGDATLGATYNLYRSIDGGAEELIDSITLDEYGSQEVFYDTPWDLEYIKGTMQQTGTYEHVEAAPEGEGSGEGGEEAEPHTCTVTPTTTEWTSTVTYRIEEIRPDGRFIEPDTGERTCAATYTAESNNSQECVEKSENWSDITYTVEATSCSMSPVTGTVDSMLETIVFDEEDFVFVNDEYRGRIFLSKSNENENVFNEEGSSGAQTISTASKWKIYLKSGGYENHSYIRFVEEGQDNSGTNLYRATRDNTGTDNATTPLTVGINGCLYVADLPYGTYVVEEVAADDESYVLESYEVTVEEHSNGYYPQDETKDNRYAKNIRDKKKENVIKVIKTDAETGKNVSAEELKNAKFYIRYMGNPLSADPTKDENYGRLLPNAADINSTSQDFTFTANDNGEIVIPYDLEFGIYRLEEWLLPEGYFVGEYDESGKAESHTFAQLQEGQNKVLASDDMYNSLVSIYDQSGAKVEYKDGSEYELNEIFNYYTFEVTKQDNHLDGTEYEKYYQAVCMPNNQVKGKIEISKTGEVLTGFKEEKVNGQTIMTPVYETVETVKDAVFGIYAAVDEWLNDGNEAAKIYDAATDEEITIPTTKSTHAGNLLESIKGALSNLFSGSGDVYETGEMEHSSGAKLWFLKDRSASEDGEYTRMYLSPEQKPTSYSYVYETSENGVNYRYDVEVLMEYKAGGKNVTDVKVIKTTSVANGYLPSLEEFITLPTASVGETALTAVENYEDTYGNIFDAFNTNDLYHAEGEKVYDSEGQEIKDLGAIGVTRFTATDYINYYLTEDDVKVEERTVGQEIDLEQSVDNNGDGDYDDEAVDDGDGNYDKEGEYPADVKIMKDIKESKTVFEWNNNVTLHKAEKGSPAVQVVKIDGNENGSFDDPEDSVKYYVLTTGYYKNAVKVEENVWYESDENGNINPGYVVPDGWEVVRYMGNPAEEPHYIIITKGEPVLDDDDQPVGTEMLFKVLLDDKVTWQDCQPNGDFEKMYVQEYDVTYTQLAGNEAGFTIAWDGISVVSTAKLDNTALTSIANPFTVTPEIDLGIGYTSETADNTTTFTATEPSAPIYFKTADGVQTEMYYFGGLTKTILTIPVSAVEANFEHVVPMITFGTGEDAVIIDWFSELSPSNPVYTRQILTNNTVTAERHEGAAGEDVYYTVTIISDQKAASAGDGVVAGERPFSITYSDGYTATIYCAESAEGNGLGVMELGGMYKTNRYVASDLIETLTTDEDGKAVSGLLPLGTYIVKELSAPDGYVTDDTSHVVELTYKDQFTPIIWKLLNLTNKAVKVEIELEKVFETAYQSGTYIPAGGATFGLYSAEKLGVDSKEAKEGITNQIGADTLIDIISVGEDGFVHSTVKLPEGTYYLKEMTTRKGYSLNETPFYFHVSDTGVDSEACEFDYAADGVSGKVVMNKYGEAEIDIDTEIRVPMSTLTVDGTTYELGETVNENGVVNTVTSAFACTEIKVANNQTVNVTLPNGKTLSVTVEGNTYKWNLNGTEKVFVPDVAETGYFAAYELGFEPVKGEDLEGKTDVLTVAYLGDVSDSLRVEIKHTPVTEEVVVTPEKPGVDANEDEDYDDEGDTAPQPAVTKTVGVLDKDGYQTYIHTASIKRIDIQTESYFGLEADSYLTLWLDTEDPQVKVEMDKAGLFKITMHDTVAGKLDAGLTPKVTLNGVNKTDDVEFTKSVTLARQDNEAGTVQVKINTLDNLNSGAIENDMDKPDEEKPVTPDIPYVPTPDTPSIRTSAVDSETKNHISLADKKITIIDTVSYYELTEGAEYVVKGVLMDKATGEPLLVDGKTVTAETKFTPEKENGTVDVTFEFDGSDLAGVTTVVFEELYILTDTNEDGKPDKDTPVAEHENIHDEKQTVYIPELGTSASLTEEGVITDIVSYENLIPGEEYTVKGTLMNKETGKAIKIDGKEVTAEAAFVPEMADGTVSVTFTFDQNEIAGKTTVVFEELYISADTDGDGKTDSEKPIGEHKDITDEDQTVDIPGKAAEIGTTAAGEDGSKKIVQEKKAVIVDTVAYKNLVPGEKYTIKGTLIDKATGEALIVNGKKVTAEKTFTPKKENGTVEIKFTFDSRKLGDKSLVVFEKLYLDGKLQAKHTDINDEGQTVTVIGDKPAIKTSASLTDTGEITDIVTYKNLTPGEKYIVKGTLMDKETGKAIVIDGEKLVAETTFTPKNADGTVSVTFTFDQDKLHGKTTVVFEELYIFVDTNNDGTVDKTEPVADHEDINDSAQTVKIKPKQGIVELETPKDDDETGEVSEVPKTGDSAYQTMIFHMMVMAVAAILLVVVLIFQRKAIK